MGELVCQVSDYSVENSIRQLFVNGYGTCNPLEARDWRERFWSFVGPLHLDGRIKMKRSSHRTFHSRRYRASMTSSQNKQIEHLEMNSWSCCHRPSLRWTNVFPLFSVVPITAMDFIHRVIRYRHVWSANDNTPSLSFSVLTLKQAFLPISYR